MPRLLHQAYPVRHEISRATLVWLRDPPGSASLNAHKPRNQVHLLRHLVVFWYIDLDLQCVLLSLWKFQRRVSLSVRLPGLCICQFPCSYRKVRFQFQFLHAERERETTKTTMMTLIIAGAKSEFKPAKRLWLLPRRVAERRDKDLCKVALLG